MTEKRPRQEGLWIILDGATPTAFRGRDHDALVPTFVQLKRTQPGVALKWFERGRVWESPEEARADLMARRQRKVSRSPRPVWRPGGEHRDPRQRFEVSRDQKRERFKARQRRPPQAGRPRRPLPPRPKGPKGSK
jgi:hypothetical protein